MLTQMQMQTQKRMRTLMPMETRLTQKPNCSRLLTLPSSSRLTRWGSCLLGRSFEGTLTAASTVPHVRPKDGYVSHCLVWTR